MPEDRRSYEQDKEINAMKIQLARHEVQISNLEGNLQEQSGMLKDIQNELKQLVTTLSNRPSWFVTIILSGLLTAIGTMAMYILSRP